MFILLHVLTGQLVVFFSTVDWALSLFYKFNCWANRYFEEGKTNAHRPINLINIEKVFRKCNRPVSEYRILIEHMIGDLNKYKALGTLWRHPRRPKLVDIVETCTALANRRRTIFD